MRTVGVVQVVGIGETMPRKPSTVQAVAVLVLLHSLNVEAMVPLA